MGEYADSSLVTALCVNVTASKNSINSKVMALALNMANRYIDGKLTGAFKYWYTMTLAPEVVPDQVVVCASLLAAGRIECIMYAVNTSNGRRNAYGEDLQKCGLEMLDDILNARLNVLGFIRKHPISISSPRHEIWWVGGLVTQGLNAVIYAPDIEVGTIFTPKNLPSAGVAYEPVSNWFSGLGVQVSTTFLSQPNYAALLESWLESTGIQRASGPMPGSLTSTLGQLAIYLGASGIKYTPQLGPTSNPAGIPALKNAGALIDWIQGPVSSGDDNDPSLLTVVSNFYSANQRATTPIMLGQTFSFYPYTGISDAVTVNGAISEISPEWSTNQQVLYANRLYSAAQLKAPLQADIAVSDLALDDTTAVSYQLWGLMRAYTDNRNLRISATQILGRYDGFSAPSHLIEHCEENGLGFGLTVPEYDGGGNLTQCNPKNPLWQNLLTLMTNQGGTTGQMAFLMSGLSDGIALVFSLATQGSYAILVSTGLLLGQSTQATFSLPTTYRVNVYQPTDGLAPVATLVAQSFSIMCDRRPLLILTSLSA